MELNALQPNQSSLSRLVKYLHGTLRKVHTNNTLCINAIPFVQRERVSGVVVSDDTKLS